MVKAYIFRIKKKEDINQNIDLISIFTRMLNKGIRVNLGVQKNCWRCMEKTPKINWNSKEDYISLGWWFQTNL